MNSLTAAKTRLMGMAVLAAVVFSGCGTSSAPEPPRTPGSGTVTFYVKGMGERLNLM